jgi:hypothetical protein
LQGEAKKDASAHKEATMRQSNHSARRFAAPFVAAALLLLAPALARAADGEAEKPAPAAKPAVGGLKVDIKIARAIDNRLPVDPADSFTPGKLYLWSEVRGGKGDFVVNHRWVRDGKTQFETPINASGPRWRTWSYLKALPGKWKVEVTDESGQVLKTAEFVVAKDTQVSSAKDPGKQPSKQ